MLASQLKHADDRKRSPASVQLQPLAELLVAGVPHARASLRLCRLVRPGRRTLRGDARQRRRQRRAVALRALDVEHSELLERCAIPVAPTRRGHVAAFQEKGHERPCMPVGYRSAQLHIR